MIREKIRTKSITLQEIINTLTKKIEEEEKRRKEEEKNKREEEVYRKRRADIQKEKRKEEEADDDMSRHDYTEEDLRSLKKMNELLEELERVDIRTQASPRPYQSTRSQPRARPLDTLPDYVPSRPPRSRPPRPQPRARPPRSQTHARGGKVE